MATPATLCERSELIKLGGGLSEHEQPERLLYAFPHIIQWLDKTLPSLPSDFKHFMEEDLSPLEQVDVLFHDFVSGNDMSYYERSHSMTPTALGVWELKTTDVRFFGWFHAPRCFIIANVDTKARCLEFEGLNGGYRDNAVFRRRNLDLNEPKFITGGYADVL
jgi:hypothetical protein